MAVLEKPSTHHLLICSMLGTSDQLMAVLQKPCLVPGHPFISLYSQSFSEPDKFFICEGLCFNRLLTPKTTGHLLLSLPIYRSHQGITVSVLCPFYENGSPWSHEVLVSKSVVPGTMTAPLWASLRFLELEKLAIS